MTKKNMTVAQIRNLPQYRNLSVEELEQVLDTILNGNAAERAERNIERFESDYDLSEMTANDKLTLLELARIFVTLEDIEASLQSVLNSDPVDWSTFEQINKVASGLRNDASKFQKDLNITRKARQDSGGQTVVDFIEDIKLRAKGFLDTRLAEVYCPNCNMLLAKVWVLYPDKKNKFTFVCGRRGCRHKFSVTSAELKTGKNIEVGPPL